MRNHKDETTPTQIDVLVAYTSGAKAAVTDIDATIALAVAEANQSYVNSKIQIQLNLVDSFEVSYRNPERLLTQSWPISLA